MIRLNDNGPRITTPITWGSPDWGHAGHNVHESSTGSWLDTETGDDRG